MADKRYYVGLDIGTNSVGWAVTDEKYNLCKFRGKSLWGVHLFDDADTAAERRTKRSARRRNDRKKQRIKLLQELFAEEMAKVDETFFLRLNSSRLHLEDKPEAVHSKYPLFIDKEYNDVNYHEEFPTIYHLRKALIDGTAEYDLRFVYLAIHHIIKNRGHFLIEGDLSNATDFEATFELLKTAIEDNLGIKLNIDNYESIENIIRAKNNAKSTRAKLLERNLEVDDCDEGEPLSKEELKRRKTIISHICKWVVGNKGDLSKISAEVGEAVDKKSFSFADGNYEEEIQGAIESIDPEIAAVIDAAKALYDWSVLVDVLDNEEYISAAKVNQYNKHKNNLADLKYIIKKYCDKDTSSKFWNGEPKGAGYANYVGETSKNGKTTKLKICGIEDFYKNLKKILESITVNDAEDKSILDRLLIGVNGENLLPLQRNKDNGTIPHQAHEMELKRILENASNHHAFLKETDESGLSVADKILSIFTFRIPYYVGPLSDQHREVGANNWMVRKADGYIYPWNFDEMVDLKASNEKFIRRMTNKCTYLTGEDVLSSNSLLYKKFTVLNELNNLKIRGKRVSSEIKQNIYIDLFMNRSRVTGKTLLAYLKKDDPELTLEDLSGFDGDFKSTLSSYLDFNKKVFDGCLAEDNAKRMAEDIIEWKTIYGDDNKMVREMFCDKYGDKVLTEEQHKFIKSFKYSGWGRLSRMLLAGIEGTDTETGETQTIIEAMWNDNFNLMELLSSRFTYLEEIQKYNESFVKDDVSFTYDNLVKDLYVSPKVKRPIWRALLLVEEIRKIMRCDPAKIFIETTRSDGEKKRTKSRKAKLLELYDACKEDTRDWKAEIEARDERDFNSIKLYLYYTQQGRCMYSGEPIDLDALMNGSRDWDRDHIFPQSLIKDDSLDNLVLVKRGINARKGKAVLSEEIRKKQYGWWKMLLDKQLITKKKFERLTKSGDFTNDELAGFINRQLVETGQSAIAVVNLLKSTYKNSKIIPVKARITSDFRKDDLNVLKSRLINDYHHAKDAYLNIVTGNVFDAKFTSNPRAWLKSDERNRDNYHMSRVFDFDVYDGKNKVWERPTLGEDNKPLRNEAGEKFGGSLDVVRKTIKRNNVLYTEYSYCDKGELFNATHVNKDGGAKIPLKKGLDPSKYGGYKSASTSYFALVEFDGKKNERVRNIMEVPIYVANMLKNNPNAYIEYLEDIKELKNVKVIKPCIKKNALLRVNGYPMRIRGVDPGHIIFKGAIQLQLNKHEETIRRVEKIIAKEDTVIRESDGYIDNDELIALYDELVDKFNTVYKKRPSNQYEKLMKARDVFVSLSIFDKAQVLSQILIMTGCGNSTAANLKLLKEGATVGAMSIVRNTVGASALELIHQSITGVYEDPKEL